MRELFSVVVLGMTFFQANAVAAPAACLQLNDLLPKVQNADNSRYNLTNITLIADDKPVSDQFRFTAVRGRQVLDTDLVGTGWRKVKQVGCESVEMYDFGAKKMLTFKIISASQTKLVLANDKGVQFTYEVLSAKRIKTTLRRPVATPHTCGDETHVVVIEGELEYGKNIPETVTMSATLLQMIQDSFPYFATPDAEYGYCQRLAETIATKDTPAAAKEVVQATDPALSTAQKTNKTAIQ